MPEYKLRTKGLFKHSNGDGYITKDGHTMFQQDIVADLERIKELEARIAMLNENIVLREKVSDYSISTEVVRIILNDPIENFTDLKL